MRFVPFASLALALIALAVPGAEAQQVDEEAIGAGITYGGELPTPEPVPDTQPEDAVDEVTAGDENVQNEQQTGTEQTSQRPSRNRPSVDAVAAAADRLAARINDLPLDIEQSAQWVAVADQIRDDVRILQRDNEATNDDALRGISRSARSLDRALSRVLQAGLPSDQFADVRDARSVLNEQLMTALAPLESAAGIQPARQDSMAASGQDPSGRGRVLARPPAAGTDLSDRQLYSSRRPLLPDARYSDRYDRGLEVPERYDWNDPPLGPNFSFRLEVPFGVAPALPPAYGYRYGYGPAYGVHPYRHGYLGVPYGYDNFLYRGYGLSPAVPVLPYGHPAGIRLSFPVAPFGFGF